MNKKMIVSVDVEIAKQVINTEIEGLQSLSQALDYSFVELVETIFLLKGKVILSGIGKSGIIAKKIASTLASTGTPSFFVHPSEASHGDLGMITRDDLVFLLSNSGETQEIRDLVSYCKKIDIKLVALVGNSNSQLANAADIKIILPQIKEASDLQSPTTSTTMMIVFGDALAVTLLEKRGFNKEDYKLLHPGGKIGSIFTKVKDLMHKDDAIPLVGSSSLMSDAIMTMSLKRLGCVGVIDSAGGLMGIICDGDLRRNMGPNLLGTSVLEIMNKNPKTIDSESLAVDAANLMNENGITTLFITEQNKPIGIIHIHDCLKVGKN
jgi:arabinose-5-phosphate isomerase